MNAYLFARDFVRERGYRLCLDGLSHLSVGLADRAKLGVDLLKIIWNADMLDDPTGKRHDELREFVTALGNPAPSSRAAIWKRASLGRIPRHSHVPGPPYRHARRKGQEADRLADRHRGRLAKTASNPRPVASPPGAEFALAPVNLRLTILA